MIIIDDIEQGSNAWHELKLGVVSASRASEFSSEPKLASLPGDIFYEKVGETHYFKLNGKSYEGTNKADLVNKVRQDLPRVYAELRSSYMAELVGQVATGMPAELSSSKQCDWGHQYEDEARAFFELDTGLDVSVPAFIYKDKSKRFGISPDGLIKEKKIGLELKCPFTTKVFIEFVTCNKIKKEYIDQCQYSMWVTGYEAWYFANYDPRLKKNNLHHVLIERDEKYMEKYDKSELSFIKDMNEMLSKMSLSFGEQWSNYE